MVEIGFGLNLILMLYWWKGEDGLLFERSALFLRMYENQFDLDSLRRYRRGLLLKVKELIVRSLKERLLNRRRGA